MPFAFVVFLSAFLLFQVQLIVAKHLLPWFGGTPAVWTTCQMFFQVLLLAGYTYAHVVTQFRASLQRRIHLALLVVALVALTATVAWNGEPVLAPASMKPTAAGSPVFLLVTILAFTVGLPFFVVSTTGPLLQLWHARHRSSSLTRTYRLYALSNAGSLIGLLSYPFGVERLLDATQQAWLWAGLFILFAAACGYVCWRVTVGPLEQKSHGHDPEWAITSQVDAQSTDAGTTRIALWLLLSFTGSVFFLATTNHLSQDVAAVPFLWALPLATYLLTFIICFDRPRWYSRRWMAIAAALASVTVPTVISNTGVPMQVAAYGAFVFCFCMLCHGELVHVRPGARYLTLFYLLVALGGALGGTFVSIVAPAVFDDIWEFQGAIVAGWIIVAMAWWKDRSSPFHDGDRWLFGSLVAFGSFLVLQYVIERTSIGQVAWVFQYRSATIFAAVALSTLCCCSLVWKRGVARVAYWPQAFVVLAIIASTMSLLDRVSRARSGTLYAARDFYGVVRVVGTETSEGDMRRLLHGTTTHGVQVNTPRYRRTATAYYTPSTGIAAAIERLLRRDPVTGADRSAGIHIGVVGMGVGTISALARAGDRVRYYEINPEVIKIVQGVTAYFTFIGDSAAEAEIITGDARLELERELSTGRPQQFDVLAMDAFSSDSVPVHLVTLEAFRVYAAHLRSHDSILAVNVTNRFLDLEPVVAANAEQLGFPGVRVDTSGERPAVFSSSWILMARNPLILAGASHPHSRVTPLRHKVVPFTDRYSNLFRVLR